MKKVVILSPAYPLRGGIAASTERLAYELQDNGYEVIIYSFSLQYPNFLFPGKTQYSSDPAPKGLKIVTCINSINPFNWLKVGWQLAKENADIIISRFWIPFMGPSLGTIIKLAKRNKKSLSITISDNIIPHEKRPGDKLLTQYFISSIDGFIVMSRSVKDDIRQFSETKPVTYIPHPIYDSYGEKIEKSAARKHLRLSDDVNYMLFFGFIRDYKGLDLLIKAMAHEKVRSKNLKLIVAGEYYGNQEYYESLITELNLQDQIVLHTDFIPHEEVKYYFGAADLVVQPYKTATQSGISQLAYHFEKPMIVTKVGGLPEIVEHGKVGYVVEVDENAISEAIVDFYEQNREAELKEGVIENKNKFSWENLVRGIEELAQSIRS